MMSDMPKGLLFVLVGPGGAGKNALMDTIMKQHPDIAQLTTATTRPMRSTEQQGKQHQFVSPEQFREMIANDELLEYQEVTPGRFYGIPRTIVENHLNNGQNLVADIEVLGAKILREHYPQDVRLIFVTVPGETEDERLEMLRARMIKRNGSLSEMDKIRVQQRLERAATLEFPFQASCDYVVVNDVMESAVQALEQIILSEIATRKELSTPEEV